MKINYKIMNQNPWIVTKHRNKKKDSEMGLFFLTIKIRYKGFWEEDNYNFKNIVAAFGPK